MSEWTPVLLGDVLAVDIETVEVVKDHEYPIVGVLNRGRGLLYRDPIRGADTAYKTLNVMRPNRVVYSRLKAFEGAITVMPDDMQTAYASAEFPTFRCGPRLIPEYFALVTTTPLLWDELRNMSTGMGGRRERVKPSALLSLELKLPPLPEQRRIVAIMSAVDGQIAALEAETESASAYFLRLRAEITSPDGGEVLPLTAVSDNLDNQRKPVKESDRAALRGLVPYYGAGGQTGWIDRALFNEPLVCLAEDGNGLLGWKTRPIAYRIDGPSWVNNHAHVLRATKVTTEWLRLSLMHYNIGSLINDGTRPKLNKSSLSQILIRVGDTESDEKLLAAVLSAVETLQAELTALRRVRSDLLTALLSQDITIDEAVDQFVEGAA